MKRRMRGPNTPERTAAVWAILEDYAEHKAQAGRENRARLARRRMLRSLATLGALGAVALKLGTLAPLVATLARIGG